MEWTTVAYVGREAWRRLLEFANADVAFEAIETRHGRATTKRLRSNYKKQAEQIRVSMLQAHEYFTAAEEAGLFTSPNHLYYGMYSLASAMMLLLGTGDRALDRLRLDSENRHHGLGLATAANAAASRSGLRLLDQTRIEVRPTGHFMNWYSTLPRFEHVYALVSRRFASGINTNMEAAGSQDCLGPSEISGISVNLLDPITHLPDIARDLGRYGVLVPCSRCNYEVTVSDNEVASRWRIHSTGSADRMDSILDAFRLPLGLVEDVKCDLNPDGVSGSISLRVPQNRSVALSHSFPSIRLTAEAEQIMYADDLLTKEVVDCYLVGYGLSMLSRYYPDYWIACLESHCFSAKAIERAVSILVDKFPVLALSEMLGGRVIISTHRAFWFA